MNRDIITEQADLYLTAREAGLDAGNSLLCTSMRIGNYVVQEGLCGVACVRITPARGKFVQWLKFSNIGYKAYDRGYLIPIHDHNQSLQRKEAHAIAFIKVLTENGINAQPESIMD